MKNILTALFFSLFISLATLAQPLPSPEFFKGFSADIDQQIEASNQKLSSHGKMFITPEKMRIDTTMTVGGMNMSSTMIMRVDKQIGWMLMPQTHTYMEIPLKPADLASASLFSKGWDGLRLLGKETVNGIPVDKYEQTTNKQCTSYIYLAQDSHVPVKSEVTCDNMRSVSNFKNVVAGVPAANLFELPGGYSKFDASAMMGIAKAMGQGNQ